MSDVWQWDGVRARSAFAMCAAFMAMAVGLLLFGPRSDAVAQGSAAQAESPALEIAHTSNAPDSGVVNVGDTVIYTAVYTNTGNVTLAIYPSYRFSAPGPDPDPLVIQPTAAALGIRGTLPYEPSHVRTVLQPGEDVRAEFSYVVRPSDLVPSDEATSPMITSFPSVYVEFVAIEVAGIRVVCGEREASDQVTALLQAWDPVFDCNDSSSAGASGDQQIDLQVAEPRAAENAPELDAAWKSDGTGISASTDIVDRAGNVLTGQVLPLDSDMAWTGVPRLEQVFCRVTYVWDGLGLDDRGAPAVDSLVDRDESPTFFFADPSLVLKAGVPVSVRSAGMSMTRGVRNSGVACSPATTYTDQSGRAVVEPAPTASVDAEDPELQITHSSDPVDLASVRVGDTITYSVTYTNTGNAPTRFTPSYHFKAPGGNPDLLRVIGWRYSGETNLPDGSYANWRGLPVTLADNGSTETFTFSYVVKNTDYESDGVEGSLRIASYPGAGLGYSADQVYCGSRSSVAGSRIAQAELGNFELLYGTAACRDVGGDWRNWTVGDQQIDHLVESASGAVQVTNARSADGCVAGHTFTRSVTASTITTVADTILNPPTTSSVDADEPHTVVCEPCVSASLTYSECWDDPDSRQLRFGISTTTTTTLDRSADTTTASITTVPVVSGNSLPITGRDSSLLAGLAIVSLGLGIIMVSTASFERGRGRGYIDF